MTVLFSDASGYTTLAETLDPELVRELMGAIYSKASDIINRYGGRVDKLMGDAVLAVFGDPVAHEDDAERAVRAAIELHEAVDELRPRFEAAAGTSFEMHSGINTGVIVTSDMESDRLSGPLGDMVNVAARLQGKAQSGEILIGPDTARLIGPRFELTDLGSIELKGRRDAVQVHRVERTAAAQPSRLASAFVGRKEELGVLLGAADALRDGRSSVVTICAEAGAGKTRLLEEFRANAEGDVRWLEGRAYPYTADTPYAALIDLLNRVARIDENDRAAEVKAKLDDMVAAVLPDDTEAAAVIGHLYGLEVNRTIDLEAFRTRLLDVLGRLLDEVARQGPTVLIFQDLHWVDPSTASLIRRLVTSLSAPLLTVCNFRPGFTLGVEGERALQLGVLSRRETGALVESLLDSAVPPDGLVAWLADRTDGNPFFVEEIVNSLIDKEVLVRTDAGWNLAGALADDTVPPTIRGLLAARIDGLSPDARRVLREASVVGREFLYRIMASVTDTPADLESGIARLSAADFIRENNLDPELEYIFKHALTQEVAYEGLLIRDRQRLHERVAQGIELHLSDRIDEFVDTLAYHYERSGHVVEAVRYLRSAAKKAVDRFAVEEADRKYAAAYALLTAEEAVGVVISADDRDRLLLEVLTDWALVFYYSCDLHRFDALYERHRELGDAVGDDTLAARWNAWAGMLTWLHRADNRAAGQMLLGAIERAQKVGDPVAEGMARSWMVWIDWTSGRVREAIDAWPVVQELLPQIDDPATRLYVEMKTLGGAATASALAGDLTFARETVEHLFAIGRATGNLRATALGYGVELVVHMCSGGFEAALASCDACIATDVDPVYSEVTKLWAAGIALLLDDPDEARRRLEVGSARVDELGMGWVDRYYRYMSAELDIVEGHLSRGFRSLDEQKEGCEQSGLAWGAAQIDLFIATSLARVATGEVQGSLGDALRNPGFVRRFGIGTAKKARARLEALDSANECSFASVRPMIRLELAKLELHEHNQKRAREHLDFILDLLAGEPESPLRLEAQALLPNA